MKYDITDLEFKLATIGVSRWSPQPQDVEQKNSYFAIQPTWHLKYIKQMDHLMILQFFEKYSNELLEYFNHGKS